MQTDKFFLSENLLMSVIGHLLLLVVLATSVAAFTDRTMLVAPDRIEILEIDLNAVNVSGNETKLFNTDAVADIKSQEKQEQPEKPKSEPTHAQDAHERVIDAPSLIQPEQTPDKKPEPTPEQKKVEPVPDAPKKKTVIRVNRESVSLNRTLNVSVVDALRVAMTRCWVIDTNRPDIADIRAVAHLTMRKNGTVRDMWFESATRAESDPAFAYVLETIRAAINTCQPLRMLPENEFEKWGKIQLTFYPANKKVM